MVQIDGVGGQIRIEVLETQREPSLDYGVMRWKVFVDVHDLHGQSDAIHIMPGDFERFLRDLVALERERQGSASLISASPEELRLTFGSVDHLGHMLLEGQLGRYTHAGEKSLVQKLVFGFEFDPSTLPSMVSAFSTFRTWSA